MTENLFAKEVAQLGAKFKDAGQDRPAAILFTLAAAMHSGPAVLHLFCELSQVVARHGIAVIEAQVNASQQ